MVTIFGYTDPSVALHGAEVQNNFFSVGGLGNRFANFNVEAFGYLAYVYLPLLLFPLYRLHDDADYSFRKVELTFASLLIFICLLVLQSLIFGVGGLGASICDLVGDYIGVPGVVILSLLLLTLASVVVWRGSQSILGLLKGGPGKALGGLAPRLKASFGKLQNRLMDLRLSSLERANKRMLNAEYSEVETVVKSDSNFKEPLMERPLDEGIPPPEPEAPSLGIREIPATKAPPNPPSKNQGEESRDPNPPHAKEAGLLSQIRRTTVAPAPNLPNYNIMDIEQKVDSLLSKDYRPRTQTAEAEDDVLKKFHRFPEPSRPSLATNPQSPAQNLDTPKNFSIPIEVNTSHIQLQPKTMPAADPSDLIKRVSSSAPDYTGFSPPSTIETAKPQPFSESSLQPRLDSIASKIEATGAIKAPHTVVSTPTHFPLKQTSTTSFESKTIAPEVRDFLSDSRPSAAASLDSKIDSKPLNAPAKKPLRPPYRHIPTPPREENREAREEKGGLANGELAIQEIDKALLELNKQDAFQEIESSMDKEELEDSIKSPLLEGHPNEGVSSLGEAPSIASMLKSMQQESLKTTPSTKAEIPMHEGEDLGQSSQPPIAPHDLSNDLSNQAELEVEEAGGKSSLEAKTSLAQAHESAMPPDIDLAESINEVKVLENLDSSQFSKQFSMAAAPVATPLESINPIEASPQSIQVAPSASSPAAPREEILKTAPSNQNSIVLMPIQMPARPEQEIQQEARYEAPNYTNQSLPSDSISQDSILLTPIQTPVPQAQSPHLESKIVPNPLDSKEASSGPNAYQLPPFSLLQPPGFQEEVQDLEIDGKIANLLSKLHVFKVRGDIVRVSTGPVVTTFEFRPEPDVKVNKVQSLQDDLAMALKARSIRIQAPIPGKDVIGIEIPNGKTQTIYLREVLESSEFLDSRAPLSIALGKDLRGAIVIENLAKLPHLLVAGTTGSGKSVGVNALILSLLYRNSPDDLRLMMIDPKQVEFAPYEDLPHLITPIINAPNKAIQALQAATVEMDRRYKTLSDSKMKNIDSYNERAESKMPAFVIVIDELADLIMTGGKEAEASITRLAQMGRAAGMHLIVATQRSSVDVVTGLIKTNLPSRISYRVGNKTDSKVILDEFGAERLLGNGDGLFKCVDSLRRIHAPLVSEAEIEKIVGFIKAQREVQYDASFLGESAANPGAFEKAGEGGMLDEAKAVILKDNRASISNLQRRLNIGYNKAATLIETLQAEGFLSAPNSKGERTILGG